MAKISGQRIGTCSPWQIEFEIGDAQRGDCAIAIATQQRLDSGEQFFDGERFAEVVVAARAQAAHALVDRVERRQHQHRSFITAGAQVADHV